MRNYMTDSAFRLSDLRLYNLRLLCFWPIFFLVFTYAEKFFPAAHYFSMHCRLDDLIPFCEWFVIPYVIWFPFVGSMVFYTLLRDAAAFRRLMRFIILTYSAALLVFFLFPTCQYLRPVLLFRGNPLVRLVASIYANDTNTNVCPSIHVIGSLAVWFAARDTGNSPPSCEKAHSHYGRPDQHFYGLFEAALRAGHHCRSAGLRCRLPSGVPQRSSPPSRLPAYPRLVQQEVSAAVIPAFFFPIKRPRRLHIHATHSKSGAPLMRSPLLSLTPALK